MKKRLKSAVSMNNSINLFNLWMLFLFWFFFKWLKECLFSPIFKLIFMTINQYMIGNIYMYLFFSLNLTGIRETACAVQLPFIALLPFTLIFRLNFPTEFSF